MSSAWISNYLKLGEDYVRDAHFRRLPNPRRELDGTVVFIAIAATLMTIGFEVLVACQVTPFPPGKENYLNSGRDSKSMVAFWYLGIMFLGIHIPYYFFLYVMMILGYKAWEATFDENWTPEGKYSWWTRLLARIRGVVVHQPRRIGERVVTRTRRRLQKRRNPAAELPV